MNKNLLAMGLVSSLCWGMSAQAAEYLIDTKGAHASINFKVSHLGYSFIKGRFNDFSGSFTFDDDNITASKVNVMINTSSLDSNHAERDKHIRSSDFIDSSKYKQAKFTSTKVVPEPDGKMKVIGDLTLHGVTKPITIDAEFVGAGKDPWGGTRAGFNGTTRLQLADFDIPVVGKSSYVDMELFIEGIKQ